MNLGCWELKWFGFWVYEAEDVRVGHFNRFRVVEAAMEVWICVYWGKGEFNYNGFEEFEFWCKFWICGYERRLLLAQGSWS